MRQAGEITCCHEGGGRLAGFAGERGMSLAELLIVVSIAISLAASATPSILNSLDAARTAAAARYLTARLTLARLEAVKRGASVAVRVEPAAGYRCTFYVDGNRNGVRSRDVTRQVDTPFGPPDRLDEKFAGVSFGILDQVTAVDSSTLLGAGTDPVRFGLSEFVSFSPDGSATAGTFYIRGRGQQQVAVRVLGITGRVRALRFDFHSSQWVPL